MQLSKEIVLIEYTQLKKYQKCLSVYSQIDLNQTKKKRIYGFYKHQMLKYNN